MLEDITGCKELSADEISMLVKIADDSSEWSQKFWLTAELCKSLSDWGDAVSTWLHQCPCHAATADETAAQKKERKQCKLKGRQSCAMSWGVWRQFQADLASARPSAEALRSARVMSESDPTLAAGLLAGFQACKAEMLFRCKQAWSFWDCLPWSIVKMAGFLWQLRTEEECRHVADELLQEYDRTTREP